MTVFSIRNDGYDYQELCLPITDVMEAAPDTVNAREIMKFHSRNVSMQSWWVPVTARFAPVQDKPGAPLPDLCLWRGHTLVLSNSAYEKLSTLLAPFGEFLPLACDEGSYWLFNCLTLGLADEFNSEQDIQSGVY